MSDHGSQESMDKAVTRVRYVLVNLGLTWKRLEVTVREQPVAKSEMTRTPSIIIIPLDVK